MIEVINHKEIVNITTGQHSLSISKEDISELIDKLIGIEHAMLDKGGN